MAALPFFPRFPQASALLLVALLLLSSVSAHAQSEISGTVRDAKSGRPLPRANVFLEGTTHGTATDDSGRFSLEGIRPGSYTVIISMVGYAKKQKRIHLYAPSETSKDTSLALSIKLPRRVKELKGVTVEARRDEWVDRLEDFRDIFLGDVPYADQCTFVNPEVLSFEEVDDGLVAHAKKPLRIRNEGLGYEITYHLSRYRASSDTRFRYGKFEFDTLTAEDEDQRTEWIENRKRSYEGSFRHFIDALMSGTLDEDGFRIRLVSTRSFKRGRQRSTLSEPEPVHPAEIVASAGAPNRIILTFPKRQFLEVEYVGEDEDPRFAQRYRNTSPRSSQVSWVQLVGGSQVLVDTQTGDFVAQDVATFGHYFLTGYWGWHETAATALPGDYGPPSDRK